MKPDPSACPGEVSKGEGRTEADTSFDTPQRTPREELLAVAGRLSANPLIPQFLESYPGGAVLVDANRQIVAFNSRVAALSRKKASDLYGHRLGEALGCLHAFDPAPCCGTSRFCAQCGAAGAIRFTRTEHGPSVQECRLTVSDEGKERALDLRVHTSSLSVDGERFTLVALEDIADEKRRETLEHVFFHDVLNTAHILNGVTALLVAASVPTEERKLREILSRSTRQLIEEIQAQRDLLLAERGDLAPSLTPTSANRILATAHGIYAASPLAAGKFLAMHALEPDVLVRTDAVQAVRCLGNLAKNALEAASPGDTVDLRGEASPGSVAFEVANPGVMPAAAQLQVFQRSFTSKAPRGRGLGTYSVKLIAEQYLHGKVSFVSGPETGTVFRIELPRSEE